MPDFLHPDKENYSREELVQEAQIRPQSFKDFAGQRKTLENLEVFVTAAKKRGGALDHVLLHGPPGLGKTTLANIIANELGVSPRTVKAWMSILESSYIAFHLMPFYTNARKQVVKTPKLYFYDTGLLCHLLGIRTVEALVAHPKFGDIFENLIIAETMKQHLNANQEPQLFFYRDASKVEVDLLDFTDPNNRMLIEIKSGQTYHDRFARQ